MEDRRRIWPRLVAWLLVTGTLLLGAYYALTGYLAVRDLQSARSELESARSIAAASPGHAQLAVENAVASAQAASQRLDGPLWAGLSAVPVVGDSPTAARELTAALTEALQALEPLVDDMDLLLASALVNGSSLESGVIDIAAPAARTALPGIEAAQQRLQNAPTGSAVLPQLRGATQELQGHLVEVEIALASVAALPTA